MRKICLFYLALITVQSIYALEISQKYGRVTDDELTMTVYEKDTSAAAVVLYEKGNTYYEYSPQKGFILITEIERKLKILKQEGTGEGERSIPYYFKSVGNREFITGLSAMVYNREDGKVVKAKLDKSYVFDEKINDRYRQMKFSLPDVKVGSVIEYKYTVTAEFISNIPDWEMQDNIPVMNSIYEVQIPEYFLFSMDTKGFESIQVKETSETQTFNLGTGDDGNTVTTSCTNRILTYTAKDLPALKEEVYVWCVRDFSSGVRFELSGTNFPGSLYKPYSQTWEDLEKTLNNDADFSSYLKLSNPYKDETKSLIAGVTDEMEKIEKIYAFIKEKIRWNDSYSFVGEHPKEAYKNGSGDNAQINYILMSMLKDAGINTFPILISHRSNGRIPYTFPSIEKLNTFIVAAELSDGKLAYMDGSATQGGINMLPINLLVDRGRVFCDTRQEKWVDLTSAAKNIQVHFIIATMDNEGMLKGEKQSVYMNQFAYAYKADWIAADDSTDIIDRVQRDNQLIVDSLTYTGKEPMSNKVQQRMVFSKQNETAGDYIYLNPMIFKHIFENPFTQSERKLPVEFDYPYSIQINSHITIPDGYLVEETPSAQRFLLDEDKGRCVYMVKQTDNVLQLAYLFELRQTIFPVQAYQAIKDFFSLVATKNAEVIVLKKKPARI